MLFDLANYIKRNLVLFESVEVAVMEDDCLP